MYLAVIVLLCCVRTKVIGSSSLTLPPSLHDVGLSSIPILEPRYFDQRVDHFTQDQRTFRQKYFVYDAYLQPGGTDSPVLFYCGPETSILSSYTATNMSMAWYAQSLGALVVSAEHRYFGESLPFGNKSFTIENIQYLAIEQTLADYAAIITFIKASVKGVTERSKVVSFGGSYGGHLSMLMRLHHSDVVTGSVASAAATCTFGNVPDSTWYDLVSAAYEETTIRIGDDVIVCGDEVRYAFSQTWSCIHNDACRQSMQSDFNLCSSVDSIGDGYLFMFYARSAFSIIAQFNYPIPWPPTRVADPLSEVCKLESSDDRIRAAMNLTFNTTGHTKCFPYNPSHDAFDQVLEAGRDGASQQLGNPVGIQGQPFSYICCRDFPQPIGGVGIFSVPSPVNFSAVSDRCAAKWGIRPNLTHWETYVQEPLLMHGSNIAFVNAGFDPVRGFSPDHNLSPSVVALEAMMGHTYDLFYPSHVDPADVVSLRDKELELVRQWLRISIATREQNNTGKRLNTRGETVDTLCHHQNS